MISASLGNTNIHLPVIVYKNLNELFPSKSNIYAKTAMKPIKITGLLNLIIYTFFVVCSYLPFFHTHGHKTHYYSCNCHLHEHTKVKDIFIELSSDIDNEKHKCAVCQWQAIPNSLSHQNILITSDSFTPSGETLIISSIPLMQKIYHKISYLRAPPITS